MFRTVSPRLLASAAGVALATGLLAAPAASATTDGRATGPAVVPSPGFLGTGVRTDACDSTTAPGWIATTAPELTARTTADRARFKVLDETGSKVFDAEGTAVDGTATVRPTGLAEGRTYTWWAKGAGGGAPTAECHFRIDTTAPALTVDSADFPSSDSGRTPQKYAGQTGTFTVAGSDAASGVACYRYVLNGTPSTGGDCTGAVRPAADGSATFTLKPKDQGTNVLTVQAFDEAGNASQPLSYTFYAPANPNPPQTVPGDVNADGVPDILLPDAEGNLQVVSADATGTDPASTTAAAYGPAGTWTGTVTAHRGWDSGHAPADDLFVHVPGGTALYLYRNLDQGAFQRTPVLLARPTACAAAGCAADWSATDQLVALGALGGGRQSSLVTVENGDLWLFRAGAVGYRYATAERLSTGGAWAGHDVVAPGRAADGSLVLWSRERATGTLRSYPVTKQADGTYDLSALADPSAGTVLAGTLPAADYPVLGSSGDGNGDGRPDLYAVTAARHLLTFDGTTAPKDLGALR
ncbi:hypothetical protein [Streptomyces sp. NRRL B-24484]|uniref:hypothetical protein n=1 Tax=Streptomyces sp. NRRL B-24484 TaxID=1463833 RepID=UPI0004C1A04B|nr:hypothetical protein [Streptomyces sp. NRRL B-24484]